MTQTMWTTYELQTAARQRADALVRASEGRRQARELRRVRRDERRAQRRQHLGFGLRTGFRAGLRAGAGTEALTEVRAGLDTGLDAGFDAGLRTDASALGTDGQPARGELRRPLEPVTLALPPRRPVRRTTMADVPRQRHRGHRDLVEEGNSACDGR